MSEEKKLNGTVIVTYRCNARCSMCNLGKSEQEFMPDEFAVPEEKSEKPAKNKKSPER